MEGRAEEVPQQALVIVRDTSNSNAHRKRKFVIKERRSSGSAQAQIKKKNSSRQLVNPLVGARMQNALDAYGDQREQQLMYQYAQNLSSTQKQGSHHRVYSGSPEGLARTQQLCRSNNSSKTKLRSSKHTTR